jgi:hypothetical protein
LSNPERLCSSLTNDRNPCNAPRFGWTRFCWHHQPWPEIGLSTVIALFVGVNATWFIALRGQQWTREAVRSLEEATNEAAHPTRRFEIPSLQPDERVLIGSVSYGKVSHDKLTLGDSDYEIDRSPEGAFYLSGEIRDRGGRNVVAQLKNSRLFVSPGLAYDFNADSSAIEVVDPESRPVLQFARDEDGLVGWIGTYQKSGEVFVCGDPCATVSEKEALPALARQRRIFLYPGYLHPGAREC